MSTPTRLWNRNFALLWQGQVISFLGKSAFSLTALLWLKDATGSGTLSGLVSGLAMLPMVLLGPVAGVFVDRVNRGRLIAWTDVAGGVLVSIAAVLFFLLPSQIPLLIACVFVVSLGTGLLDAFSQPSITASYPDLVPRDKLEAANSLGMSGLHLAMLVSQGVSGLLYRLLGAPLLVAVNAVAYLWAGFSELGVKTPDVPRKATPGVHPWKRFQHELMEGFRYTWNHRGLRTMLLVYTVLNLCVAPLLALMAFLVQDYMGLGPQWLGYLMACFGGGGLVGFALAGIFRVKGVGREMAVGGAGVLVSATIPLMLIFKSAGAEVALFLLAGVANGYMNVHVNTLLQLAAPAELRGRVQSVATTLSGGIMPLGMAISGVVFDLTGQNFWLVIGLPGVVMLVVSALALLSKEYRGFLAGRGEAAATAAGPGSTEGNAAPAAQPGAKPSVGDRPRDT